MFCQLIGSFSAACRPTALRRPAWLGAVLFGLAVLLGAGCGRPDPPPYDAVRGQLMRALFAALEDGDTEVALNCAARLAAVSSQTGFLDRLAVHERHRVLIARVDGQLLEGNAHQAMTVLKEAIASSDLPAPLEALSPRVAELMALQDYLAARPFADAEAAATALATLEQQAETLAASTPFRRWLAAEQEQISRRRDLEAQRHLRQARLDLDLAVAIGDEHQTILADSVAALQPAAGLAYCRDALLKASAAETADLLKSTELLADQMGLEISGCLYWRCLAEPVKDRLSEWLLEQPAASLAGLRLRAVMAARNRNPSLVVETLQQLHNAAGQTDPALAGVVIETLLMPRKQFEARPWRTPFPAVGDLLNRSAQIRDFYLLRKER